MKEKVADGGEEGATRRLWGGRVGRITQKKTTTRVLCWRPAVRRHGDGVQFCFPLKHQTENNTLCFSMCS